METGLRSPRAGPRPLEELRDAIDLVVVPSTREGEQLVEEGGEPRRLFRQQHVTGFEARRLRFHAHPLAAFRHDADRPWKPVCRIVPQILDQLQPRPGPLDQDGPCLVSECEVNDLASERGELDPGAPDIEEIELLLLDGPGGADRPVIALVGRRRDVPALHDPDPGTARGGSVIGPEPLALDEVAFGRNGALLVLCGELETADLGLDPLQGLAGLALRMEYGTRLAVVKFMRADRHRLVIRGDRRETELMPAAALDHEAGEVFLVQPLHHQDDDAPLLVVEPCAERAVVPVDDPCACCFGGAEGGQLPDEFLVWTARRRFEVLDGESLRDMYLPDDAEKGRSVWEGGKGVLEMPVREANRLAALLVDATAIRRASALEERILIDGAEWTGVSDVVSSLEDTRYRWLPAPLLAIAAHGGQNPTGTATQGWAASVGRLRGAGVVECESVVVELIAGAERIAESAPPAWWLPGDVLAVTREIGAAYEKLAPAVQAMLDRQDLIKDLRLVLGAVDGLETPSVEEIEGALDRAEIDALAFADVRSHWAGNTGQLASRTRPVAELLGVAMEEFESAALDADGLTDWLANNVSQWEARKLISAARRSRDDHAMGLEAWRAMGDVAQLPAWNAVLERLGDEYEPVENKDVDDQTSAHLEAMRPLLQAVSRHIAIKADEPDLFPRIEAATGDFNAPDGWPKRWWDVPFSAVFNALYCRWGEAVAEIDAEALLGATSVGELRAALVEKGVEIDLDPYETARVNRERFGKVLLEVHDLHRTWVEVRTPESEMPDRPTMTDLGAEANLRRWSEAELWRRALAVLVDKRFIAACGDFAEPSEVRERLGIDEAAVAAKRHERSEQDKEAAHKPKKMEIAEVSFEIETIDYTELLREHIDGLEEPAGPRAKDDEFTPLGTLGGHGGSGGGSGKKRKSSHRRPSPEEALVVGVVGEMHAYRYLRKEFGGRAVRARAWVSETRLKVLPLVEGEPNETSDGHGFDFRFSHGKIGWRVEVKATRGDEPSFDLGISEIQAATDIARRQSDRLRWRILRVRNALSRHPEFDWLPNPFEDGFRNRFRLHQGGMFVSYVRRRD